MSTDVKTPSASKAAKESKAAAEPALAGTRLYRRIVYTYFKEPECVDFSYVPKEGNEEALANLETWAHTAAGWDGSQTVQFGDVHLSEADVDALCRCGNVGAPSRLEMHHRKLAGPLKPTAATEEACDAQGLKIFAHKLIGQLFAEAPP